MDASKVAAISGLSADSAGAGAPRPPRLPTPSKDQDSRSDIFFDQQEDLLSAKDEEETKDDIGSKKVLSSQ